MSSPQTTTAAAPAKSSVKANNSIMGIGMLLVVASIAYTSTVIVLGTQGWVPLVMVAPQALFALGVLFIKFTKQGVK